MPDYTRWLNDSDPNRDNEVFAGSPLLLWSIVRWANQVARGKPTRS